ncbi:uncharacterized protein [Primulina eburnea]|uniref:uncharacterized protein n=1 Tax=Primulina eburnea TaxID=1245227 RepID=UPI003C6C5127
MDVVEHLGGTMLAPKAMLDGFWWQSSARVVQALGMDIVGPFLVARAQKKFLLVAVEYFSKWVEAEPLARITEKEVLKFLWKNITEVVNMIIVQALKTRVQGKGKEWLEELPSVLWAHMTTPRAPIQETPFHLVYGSKVVIPVEIEQYSVRVESYPDDNDQSRTMELDKVEEKREQAMIRMEAYRGRILKTNKRVRIRDFQIGNLVMKKVNPARDVGKLEARWE